jgi:hypothetical protein
LIGRFRWSCAPIAKSCSVRGRPPRIAPPGDLGSLQEAPPERSSCGGQRLFDEPAAGDAPGFVVETHLVTNGELQALVAEAEHHGYSPMDGWY